MASLAQESYRVQKLSIRQISATTPQRSRVASADSWHGGVCVLKSWGRRQGKGKERLPDLPGAGAVRRRGGACEAAGVAELERETPSQWRIEVRFRSARKCESAHRPYLPLRFCCLSGCSASRCRHWTYSSEKLQRIESVRQLSQTAIDRTRTKAVLPVCQKLFNVANWRYAASLLRCVRPKVVRFSAGLDMSCESYLTHRVRPPSRIQPQFRSGFAVQ